MAIGSGKQYSTEQRHQSRRIYTLTVVYVVMVLAGVAAVGGSLVVLEKNLPSWLGVSIALACSVPMVAVFVGAACFAWRHEGVEQAIYARATSTAFILMMMTSLLLGMLEVFARVEPFSVWWIYAVGGTTWIASNFVLILRLR